MMRLIQQMKPSDWDVARMLTYIADLELEVDRLRKHGQFCQLETLGTLKRIRLLCGNAAGMVNGLPPLPEIEQSITELMRVVKDLQDPSDYHPAFDQVVDIALRPFIDKVFRCQQRIVGAAEVTLHLQLDQDHIEWFPGRLRHVMDNLISNGLRFRDVGKKENWIRMNLRVSPDKYVFRIEDNGVGMSSGECHQVLELFYRAAPMRAAGMGVGLAVVKLLVEQCGGSLSVDSGEGQGTTLEVALPRFDLNDHLG